MTNHPTAGRWIVRTKPNPQARLRLFCFPYAGGGSSTFAAWSQSLRPSVEVCAVQLPGREGRLAEPPYTEMNALVEKLADVLAPSLDKPFVVFGHSNGGLIGFEFIRRLRRLGRPQPLHFFTSGCRAPHLKDPNGPIYALPDAEFIAEIGRLNGTPADILNNQEVMELMLPLLRADYTLHDLYAYAPGEPLDCPITAFGGEADDQATLPQLIEWRAQTRGQFNLHMLPGDHFFIRSESALLLRYVSAYLDPLLG